MPKVHVTRQPRLCAHTLAKLFARLIPVLCKWCARTSKDSPSGLGDFVGGGGLVRSQAWGTHSQNLRPMRSVNSKTTSTRVVFVYYSPLKTSRPYLAALLRPRCGCGRSRTDAHRRACARVALGLSIRMHRIACAYARGTQPAPPCTHLACAASARLTQKLLHTGRTPILWRVS